MDSVVRLVTFDTCEPFIFWVYVKFYNFIPSLFFFFYSVELNTDRDVNMGYDPRVRPK